MFHVIDFSFQGEAWKPALLSIYVLVTLIVVIILILAIIFYQGY